MLLRGSSVGEGGGGGVVVSRLLVAEHPGEAVVADALVGSDAVPVGAVAAARLVAVGPLPTVLAVTFESVAASSVVASRQGYADVTVGTFPTDFAGAVVGSPALSVNTSLTVVITDWLQARVQGALFALGIRFSPS